MVECAWLAYEEGCVIQDVLATMLALTAPIPDEAPLKVRSKLPEGSSVVTLEFASVTYERPSANSELCITILQPMQLESQTVSG